MEKDSITYANFGQRFLAFLIDFLVLFIATSIIWLIFQLPIPDRHTDLFGAIVLFVNPFGSLFSWLYYAIMESSMHQGTLGKIALGIRVVNVKGEKISFMNATGRFFGKFISSFLLGFGYFMIIFTKKHQALHDIMASTYLIKGGSPEPHSLIEKNDATEDVKYPHHLQEYRQQELQQTQPTPNFGYERKLLSDSLGSKLLTEDEYKIKLESINTREQGLNEKEVIEKQLKDKKDYEIFFNHHLNIKAKPLISKLDELKRLNLLSEEELKTKTEIVIFDCKTELEKVLTYESFIQSKLPPKSPPPNKPESHGIARLEL
jgi:uncharacterized RDD family membrane protein YckC